MSICFSKSLESMLLQKMVYMYIRNNPISQMQCACLHNYICKEMFEYNVKCFVRNVWFIIVYII